MSTKMTVFYMHSVHLYVHMYINEYESVRTHVCKLRHAIDLTISKATGSV